MKLLLLALLFETFGPARRIYPVISVHDGDTFNAQTAEVIGARGADPCRPTPGRVTIRMFGIAAPEVEGPFGRDAERLGPEAAARLKGLLAGRSVWLEFERGRRRDRYGRTLAHAHLYPTGELLNVLMVREGFAKVSIVGGYPRKHVEALRESEAEARAQRRGVWSEE